MTKPINSKLHIKGEVIETNEQLVDLYQRQIKQLGMSGETMFYSNEAQHQIKVTQFSTLLHKLVKPEESILDIGCGYGSLSSLVPNCSYLGIDLVPEFITYARQKYTALEFEVSDLEEYEGNYDWGVLLGVVNSVPYPDKLVELAWNKCKQGLLIDFVDENKLPNDYIELNRFEIGACLTKLLELGARKVEILVTSNVWTIFVVKKAGIWLRSRI